MTIHSPALPMSMTAALLLLAATACEPAQANTTVPDEAAASPDGETVVAPSEEEELSGPEIDDRITSRVNARLQDDPDDQFGDVVATTSSGVVTLSGTVATASARNVAGYLADDVEDVQKIVNDISVNDVGTDAE
jgi:hypothetical protein